MNKKITGVPVDKEDARSQVIQSRSNFNTYSQILNQKKNEHKQLKLAFDQERKQIKKEQRDADALKFTGMKKKIYFLPTVTKGSQFTSVSSIDIGTKYVDDREKMKNCMPDKTFKKGIPQWNYQKTCDGDVFYRSVRQEAEVYDENYLKYMRTLDRGLTRPKPMTAIAVKEKLRAGAQSAMDDAHGHATMHHHGDPGTKSQIWRPTNSLVWKPNDFLPNLLGNTKALNDRTHTPRGANKAISLERAFDAHAWMYNRKTMDSFDPSCHAMQNDKNRGKMLKKIIKTKNHHHRNGGSRTSISPMTGSKADMGSSYRMGQSNTTMANYS